MNVNTKNFLRIGSAYMMRNDGEIFDAGSVHPYVNYDITVKDNYAIIEDGRFSFWWQWLYKHTNSEEVKERIIKCVKILYSLERSYDEGIELPDNYTRVYAYFRVRPRDIIRDVTFDDFRKEADRLSKLVNQEFLRFRVGGYVTPKKGSEDEIYFRISSEKFNWFDLIWTLLYNNQNIINKMTVTRDKQSTKSAETIKIKGDILFHYPVKDFLELPGNPIIEKFEGLKNKRIFLK